MKNTARGGGLRDSYSTRHESLDMPPHAVYFTVQGMDLSTHPLLSCCIFHNTRHEFLDTSPHAVFFVHTSIGGTLNNMLYFLVVWLGEVFITTRTAANLGDQDIIKCLNKLFLTN